MKDKSKIILIVVILAVAALIAYICYGISKGEKNPVVTMEVSYIDADGNEKNGTVKMELYPDVAPESVANFIALANNGFYDGLTFHRVEDFVIQGGDKEGTGSGSAKRSDIDKSVIAGSYDDYTYGIKGEFSANGVNNSLKFEKGVVGMARTDYSSYGMTEEGYNSASTQFFIVNTDDKSSINSLNQNYAPFGRVIEGYEYIEEIINLYKDKKDEQEESSEEKTEKNVPKMKSVRVDTFGAKYDLPNTINMEQTLATVSQYQQLLQNYQQQSQSQVEGDMVVDNSGAEE